VVTVTTLPLREMLEMAMPGTPALVKRALVEAKHVLCGQVMRRRSRRIHHFGMSSVDLSKTVPLCWAYRALGLLGKAVVLGSAKERFVD